MSLPHLAGPKAPFWPPGNGYLAPEPDRLDIWRERLASHDGPTIAIAWQGDTSYQADNTRSIPLAAFAPIAQIPNIRLISLQQGQGQNQIAAFDGQQTILDLGNDIDQDGAFVDSAAILSTVDLMVTSDTSLAHLAGALGTPVWVALSNNPDWRWGTAGDACGWYPSMRLFRQDAPGDWGAVFNNIATSLKETLT